MPLQMKLLRALQERQIRRVGGTALIDVDVRVVSATNRDLREAIGRGQFREELFYRVNVIAITLPPLRERRGDVRLLAHTSCRHGRARPRWRMRSRSLTATPGPATREPRTHGAGLRARRRAHDHGADLPDHDAGGLAAAALAAVRSRWAARRPALI
jgi:hypothetical protein